MNKQHFITIASAALLNLFAVEALANTTYEYDALGRLTVTKYDDNNDGTVDRFVEYTYDAAGNRTQVETDPSPLSQPNLAPEASNDGAPTPLAMAHNTALVIDVLANDTDADLDTLTITTKTDGTNGSVSIAGDGSSVTYTPTAGASGEDWFLYTISDGNGGSDTASVTVDVAAILQG